MNCIRCGDETANPKFCSKSCSASYTNSQKPKRKMKMKKCKGCTTMIGAAYSTYCSDKCYRQSVYGYTDTKTISDVIYTKHHKSSAYALIRSRARTVMKDHTSCEECGYSKHVEIAHVKPIASYLLDTLVSVVNDRSNLKVLCPNCHWEFDHPK